MNNIKPKKEFDPKVKGFVSPTTLVLAIDEMGNVEEYVWGFLHPYAAQVVVHKNTIYGDSIPKVVRVLSKVIPLKEVGTGTTIYKYTDLVSGFVFYKASFWYRDWTVGKDEEGFLTEQIFFSETLECVLLKLHDFQIEMQALFLEKSSLYVKEMIEVAEFILKKYQNMWVSL